MFTHKRFSGKALLLILVVFLLTGLLMAGAALSLSLLPLRMHMHAWNDSTDTEMHHEDVATVRRWGFPGRFMGLPFLCGIKAIFHLGMLVLLVGLFARLFHHRRWHACHPECAPDGKHEHPPFGPHGYWHHHHSCRPGEAENTNEAESAGQETQEFKVG